MREAQPGELDDLDGVRPDGHLCLYLFDHEIHTDLFLAETDNDVAELASGIGKFIEMIILQTLKGETACRH